MAAVGQAHPRGFAAVAGDLGDLHPAAQVHVVLAVQVGEDLGDLAAEDPKQRQFRRLQHGDLDAGGAGRGRGFQADPAAADHRHPWRAFEGRLDLVAVGDSSQVEHAVQASAGTESRGQEPVASSSFE